MFFGREELLLELNSLWGKRVSSLVTCRGRRRIGKTALVEQFAERSGARFIRVEGVRPAKGHSNEDELKTFAQQLAVQCGCERTVPLDWLSAFQRLSTLIRDTERTVVLLDEISWLGHYDPLFADTVKIAWDRWWKKHDRLVVVLCGSVSSWIKENIVDNGEFVGRRSLDVVVGELSLDECVRFWGNAAKRIDVREILDVLSVTGGVPKYLEEIRPGLTAAENIRELCFRPKSVLREDFDDMFRDVITQQPKFSADVLRTLTDGPKNVVEICAQLGVGKGGRVTDALLRLSEAGFVSQDAGRNPETGADIRERCYRLKDNYARFYLKYVEPSKSVIDEGGYDFGRLERLPGWDAVMGLQFENLVVNNYRKLLPHLHLAGALVLSAAPYRKTGKRGEGCQIDLLLQAQRFVCLVEVKRCLEIGREVVAEMEAKVSRLRLPSGVSVRTALVYEGKVHPAVEAEGYFDALVDIRALI